MISEAEQIREESRREEKKGTKESNIDVRTGLRAGCDCDKSNASNTEVRTGLRAGTVTCNAACLKMPCFDTWCREKGYVKAG